MSLKKTISVNCFGEFKAGLMNDGKEVNWRTKKSKELFAFLLHSQNKVIKRNYLLEKIWPDKPLDNAINALHNTIYHIRYNFNEIGFQEIIQYDNRNYRMNKQYVYSELDYYYLVANAVENKNMDFLSEQKTVFLDYRGRYMSDVSGEWHIERANYFEDICVKGCYLVAKSEIEKHNYSEAIKYLNQGLKVNEFAENLSALLIYCYGKLRDLKNMRREYIKISGILKDELGIEKSSLIERSYQSALKSYLIN